MVLKTELVETERETVLRLVGRITSPEVERLQAQVAGARTSVVLDLEQVDLVDLDATRFLAAAELRGIELRHVPRYIREWIHLEKPRVGNE
jgi:anti-anti-sigma regulatory factor